MSMIEEQVRRLRKEAKLHKDKGIYLYGLLNEAADTIESLSAKLQAANEEQSRNKILKEIREKAQELSNQHWGDDERHLIGKGIQCMCVQAENIIKANMERPSDDSKTERLTERTNDGILVKEDYGEGVLKTLYQCYGAEPMPHCANCDEGYCAMEKLVQYEDLEEQREMKGGWIPCSKRLPEESLDSVIGWDECRKRCCFVQYLCGRWILGNDTDSVKITAWQPLPEEYHG